MHHVAIVGVGQAIAEFDGESNAALRVERVIGGVLQQVLAIDVLHHQVRRLVLVALAILDSRLA